MPDEDRTSIADAIEEQEPQAPDQSGQAAQPDESPSYFEDKFDPATLPDEIREQYNEMRGAFTQKTQTLAEQRQEAEQAIALQEALLDPERQPEILRALGYDVEDGEPQQFDDSQFEDPNEARLAALEQYLQERHQMEEFESQQAAEMDYVAGELEALEKQTGRDFTDEEVQALLALAVLNRNDEGAPDVKGAYEHLYSKVFAQERKRYTQQKRPPHVQANGSSATEEIDTDSPDKRVEAMLQHAQANEE